MSGGSFNYLCFSDPEEMASKLYDLGDMANALSVSGAHAAAEETEKLIAYIEHSQRQIRVRCERLQKIWKAVEWERSGDTGKDDLESAIKEYNDS